MNITLIGMPGSGKSSIGKMLAERLSYNFIEPDKLIEDEYHLPLQKVLEKLGQESFLEKEAEITISSTGIQSGLVVSPSGSIVYSKNAMEHLKKNSLVIYLKVSLGILEKRIGNAQRGIVGLHTASLQELFAERTPLYENWASVAIDGEQHPEIVVENILRAIAE